MVDIFVFKFRQKFEIITRIGMYFSLFYIFGFDGYKEVNQFWKSLALFTFVISFLSILYYLYFVIDFKKKEKEYIIDYDIKNIEYTWNDKEYKKFLVELKEKVKNSQLKAAVKVNYELLDLYWNLGKEITEKQVKYSWGEAFIQNI